MNKSITTERTWQLVQFEPLRVSDVITDIPEQVASNPEAMKLLRYLQLVDIEWTYVQYAKLRAKMPRLTSVESIDSANEYLEEERRNTFENLLKAMRLEYGTEEKIQTK
jgi:hypothetical protein